MPFFQRPDFKMHYEVIDGALPQDTIFLHGNLSANLWWEPAIEAWKEKRSDGKGRMILAEWRGCGKSTEFSDAFDLPNLASDVIALLDHLNLKKAHLVAHSTGGLIGLHAIAAEPTRFDRAVLLDTVAPDGIQFGPEMIAAFEQMSKDRNFCAAVILGTIHGGDLTEAFRQRIAEAAFSVSPLIWKGVPRLLENPPALALEKLTQPILLLHGERDGVLPLEKSHALAASLSQATFQELKDRGHCTNVEDPKLFVELTDRFLFS